MASISMPGDPGGKVSPIDDLINSLGDDGKVKTIEAESPDGDAKLEAAVVKSGDTTPSMSDAERVQKLVGLIMSTGDPELLTKLQEIYSDTKSLVGTEGAEKTQPTPPCDEEKKKDPSAPPPKPDNPGTTADDPPSGPNKDAIPTARETAV